MDETPFDTMFFVESSTLVVLGCIDELHLDTFRERLRAASRGYEHDLVVDLSEAEFVPSLAIGTLIGARKACEANGVALTFEARERTIGRRVLEICGFPVSTPAVSRATVPTDLV
jgi:anti-anti-sigma factor